MTNTAGSTGHAGRADKADNGADNAELRRLGDQLRAVVADAESRGWSRPELFRLLQRAGSARRATIIDNLDGLASWAARHRLTPAQALDEVRRTVIVVSQAPELPPDAATSAGEVDSGVLGKVRALLAKAESTSFPAEADALTDKAHELMQRYSIDQALLAGSVSGAIGTRRVLIDDPYARARFSLLSGIARASGCQAILWGDCGVAVVCGRPPDLATTEMLYTSLLVQALKGLANTPVDEADAPARKAAFRRAYMVAFARRIAHRLTVLANVQADEVGRERGIDLVPVLSARDDAVEAAVRALSPNLKTMSSTVSDRRGWAAGVAAADRATLANQPSLPDLPGQLTA